MVKAAICRAFTQPLTIEDITIAAPQHGEILIDIKACAICHSDIAFMDGKWGGPLPAIYGHEAAGIIAQVGDGVKKFKVGDHVLVTLVRYCGHCHYCDQGQQLQCEHHFRLDGHNAFHNHCDESFYQSMKTGAFAEQIVVDQSQIIHINPDIPKEIACLFSCGVITGFCAVTNCAKIPVGANAVVIGCGGVGLHSIQACTISGAKNIVAVDIKEEKLQYATTLGATHTINGHDDSLSQHIIDICDKRGADYIFMTLGSAEMIEKSLSFLAKAGTMILVGMPPIGAMSAIEAVNLVAYQQQIIGSVMGNVQLQRDIPYLVDLYQQKRLKLDGMISNIYPLDDINRACEETRQGNVYRNVIKF